jgi:5-methylcytosine-specific restriction endonuclease McrA
MIPTPEQQIRFLRDIQRLLAEGLFVASYKFALLHAIADLAVLKGDDSGAPLDIDTREIAAKFIELYWRQCRPFLLSGDTEGLILQQNTGEQAEIISKIMESQRESDGSLFRVKQSAPKKWSSLVRKVERVVQKQPLWKLQTVGREKLEFLYQDLGTKSHITLRPGVVYCCRNFCELLRDLIEGAWVRFIQKLNADRLGSLSDLGTFLFGQARSSLDAYRPILFDVQKGVCLYCQKPLLRQTQVDHFIPWSRYPADLGHNFVLAHIQCNSDKSDYVAAEEHLAAWAQRNADSRVELNERLIEASLPCDPSATVQIARWICHQTEKANGQVWVTRREMKHLSPGWEQCLGT